MKLLNLYRYYSAGHILELRQHSEDRIEYWIDSKVVCSFESLSEAFDLVHSQTSWPVINFQPPRHVNDWSHLLPE